MFRIRSFSCSPQTLSDQYPLLSCPEPFSFPGTHLGSDERDCFDCRFPNDGNDVAEPSLEVRPDFLVHVLVGQPVRVPLEVLEQGHPDGTIGRRVHPHDRLDNLALVLFLVVAEPASSPSVLGGGRKRRIGSEVEDDGQERSASRPGRELERVHERRQHLVFEEPVRQRGRL